MTESPSSAGQGMVSASRRSSGGGSAPSRRRKNLIPQGLGWMLPAFVFSAGLVYACISFVGYVSVLPWNWRPGKPMDVAGLESYARMLQDRVFWMTLRHTLVFFVGSYVMLVVMGIVFAALLHSKVYLATLFKVLIFIPVVVAPAIMAPVHRRVFAVDGPINAILEAIGLVQVSAAGRRDWVEWLQIVLDSLSLSDVTPNWIQPATSLWVIVGANVFGSVGIAFILFYAAMGQIDPEVLEAARVDGAGNLSVLWWIIVPAMRPTMSALAILHGIASLKLFDYPYLITGGGPANSSEFLGTHIYNNMFGVSNNFGYASAMSVIMFVLALLASFLISAGSVERRPRHHRRGRQAGV